MIKQKSGKRTDLEIEKIKVRMLIAFLTGILIIALDNVLLKIASAIIFIIVMLTEEKHGI